jgi:hypothetical protein
MIVICSFEYCTQEPKISFYWDTGKIKRMIGFITNLNYVKLCFNMLNVPNY